MSEQRLTAARRPAGLERPHREQKGALNQIIRPSAVYAGDMDVAPESCLDGVIEH